MVKVENSQLCDTPSILRENHKIKGKTFFEIYQVTLEMKSLNEVKRKRKDLQFFPSVQKSINQLWL